MQCVFSGNTSQYTGLVHAAVSKHAVAAGGSFGACGGGDALPTRPVQVQGGHLCVCVCPCVCLRVITTEWVNVCVRNVRCRSYLGMDTEAERGEDRLQPSHCSLPIFVCFLSQFVFLLALPAHVQFPSLPGVARVFLPTGSLRFLILSPATLPISSL